MVTPRPIVSSYNHNYFNRITVASGAFNTAPDVILGITGNPSLSLINEGTGTIQYSFNGNTVAGDLVPGTPSAQMVFNHRGYSQIWFRLSSGVAYNVRIEATSDGEITIGGGVSASLTNPLPVTLATSTDSLQTSFSTQPDYSVSTIVQLTALAAKSQGILVTAHPSNTQVVRISGSDVSTTEGQPLGAGASFTFAVTNASILWAVAESGTQKICVSAV